MLPVIEVSSVRAYPPRVSSHTSVFWSALHEGRWITTQCGDCGRQTFPPKTLCPHCWSSEMRWEPMCPRGILYSFTRVHAPPAAFSSQAPYGVGIVDLDSGLRLACRLVELPGEPVRIGMPVEIVRLAYEDGDLFAARPLA